MKKIKPISIEEENYRTVDLIPGGRMFTSKKDPIEPVPVGTVILLPFRVTGYDQDCDGSLMARLAGLHVWEGKLEGSGWCPSHLGIERHLATTEEEVLALHADAAETERDASSRNWKP